tara:strand:+ start:14870 stop:15019 length:150 start_codon:yes stop_codon:yes gene_type:complete
MKIIIKNKEYVVKYQETKIGDQIFDPGTEILYTATINDADNLNWIVINF